MHFGIALGDVAQAQGAGRGRVFRAEPHEHGLPVDIDAGEGRCPDLG
jgi:hypothetical protein